eukprot:gene1776-3437_t
MAERPLSRKRCVDPADSEGDSFGASQGFKRIMRSGKWSQEEESFANRLVLEFESGWLKDCEDGCTLRSYLARKLNCAPMRISKKFAGRCIGKLVFTKGIGSMLPHEEENILKDLEYSYFQSYTQGITSSVDSKSTSRSGEDNSDLTSAESGNDSGVEAVEESDQEQLSKSETFRVSSGMDEFTMNEMELLRFDFLDCSSQSTDAIVEPHEWQDVLSFFCDENY